MKVRLLNSDYTPMPSKYGHAIFTVETRDIRNKMEAYKDIIESKLRLGDFDIAEMHPYFEFADSELLEFKLETICEYMTGMGLEENVDYLISARREGKLPPGAQFKVKLLSEEAFVWAKLSM